MICHCRQDKPPARASCLNWNQEVDGLEKREGKDHIGIEALLDRYYSGSRLSVEEYFSA